MGGTHQWFSKQTQHQISCTRDVYDIESILSYQYHKTVTGIISK